MRNERKRTPVTGNCYEEERKRTPVTGNCYEEERKRTPVTGNCFEEKRKRTPVTGNCFEEERRLVIFVNSVLVIFVNFITRPVGDNGSFRLVDQS